MTAVTVTTPPSAPAPHRALRAAVAAAAAIAAGAGAHTLGGGSPSATGVALGFAALLGPMWRLAGREQGWGALAAVQLVGQALAHAVLGVFADAPPTAGVAVPEDVWLYGHLAAAALVAAWLRAGERWTWTAARRAARTLAAWWHRLRRLARRAPHPVAAVACARVERRPVRRDALLLHVVVRRGPPLPA